MNIKIGSRKSDLARMQAQSVGQALLKLPSVTSVDYVFKSSLGDQNQEDPLWQMPEKGVFTQDLTLDLENGLVDLVVHSWKDLPVEDREKTFIAGTLPRADQRDVLLFRKDRWSKLQGQELIRVFSSSPRRAYNLTKFLSWALPWGASQIQFETVRGNIQTRIQKLLESEEVDALVVAKAALDRMLSATETEYKDSWEGIRTALQLCQVMVLPLKENPTAAAQGAIALEVRRDHRDLVNQITKINCEETYKNAKRERKVLKKYGGGCHQKIGVSALSRPYGEIMSFRGLTDQGEVLESWILESLSEKISMNSNESFPLDMASARLSNDEDLDLDHEVLERAKSIFVSKSRAFPVDYMPDEDQVIWVAGSRTWRKLAEKGVWVTGSFEALGEAESPRLENLMGPLNWLKLTHEAALEHSNENAVATYRLTESRTPSDLGAKAHFFWTSYSSFKKALEACPEIRDKDHSCGPGKTAELIEKELKRKPRIYISFKEWKSEIQ